MSGISELGNIIPPIVKLMAQFDNPPPPPQPSQAIAGDNGDRDSINSLGDVVGKIIDIVV